MVMIIRSELLSVYSSLNDAPSIRGSPGQLDLKQINSKVSKNKEMNHQTRIGFGSLGIGPGSITLPEQVTLVCPRCETPVADKGQCIANFEVIPDPKSITQASVKVLVDCRNCGCSMCEPAIKLM
jgi:hypothetical protein